MDFCDKKCCFGQAPCKSFGVNEINIAGNHKVCNLHFNDITFLQSLQCPYCDSVCKITLDCIPPSKCPTCQALKPKNQIEQKYCGHLHCNQCAHSCEKLIPIKDPYEFHQPLMPHKSETSISKAYNYQGVSRVNSIQNFNYNSPSTDMFSKDSISTLKICPNCGDKMQEIKQKCGHVGCLGCYNLKPCIFCKLNIQNEVNTLPCTNCGKLSKEVKLRCGHQGCESCVFISDCKTCKTLKNTKKKCENCGEFSETIPFECQHNGCLKCCQNPCNICYAKKNEFYNMNRNMYENQVIKCPSCSMFKILILNNCGHHNCETCWRMKKCQICANAKCQNCLLNFPVYNWRGCSHKLCLKCSQSEEKCKSCYKRCNSCQKIKFLDLFKKSPKYCNDCFNSTLKSSSNCNFCNYNRLSIENKLEGKTICDDCVKYLFEINAPPGTSVCKYCGEIGWSKKFNCGHECCSQCFKNTECYDCLANVKNIKKRNQSDICIYCKKQNDKYVKLLCNHPVCNKCYNKEFIHLDYRCRWCQLSNKCIRCRKLAEWTNNGYTSIKTCCNLIICNKCCELAVPNHICQQNYLSDCLIF